ncbi:diguanylate cyclase domain-containing protein [Marinobacterium litorale]|uniref:diguanylate cyclase domain-containing protein n=1 Tax=Marinobacterium litorale TaxID=404770 RepID=UPI0003F4BF1F|nr:diguanylate cyclase [Marinobacterium litorale]
MVAGWLLVLLLLGVLGWQLRTQHRKANAIASVDTLNALSQPVLIAARDGSITFANPAAAKLLGYSVEELRSTTVEQLVPREQRHHHPSWRQRFIEEGRKRPIGALNSLLALHKSGRKIPVQIELTPTSDNRVICELHPSRDNDAMFDQVQQDAGVGTWEWDLDSDQLSWSANVFAMFGLDPHQFEASYEAYIDRVHPEDRSAVDQAIKRSRQTGEPYEIEYRIQRGNDVRHLLERNYLFLDTSGEIRHMWGSVIDITAKREADARLQLADAVFENCAEAILVFDANEQLIRANAALFAMIEAGEKEVAGAAAAELIQRGEDLSPIRLSQLLASDGGSSCEWRGELMLQRAGKPGLEVLASVTPIIDASSGRRSYVLVCSDISLIKAHEAELRFQALHDQLTGLPNRHLFAQHLKQEIARSQRTGTRLAVVYCDLDGFKQVNDRFGHAAGDELLRLLGKRMRELIRDADILARIGGDEFALILPDCGPDEALELLLERLITNAAYDYRGTEVTLSLGACCSPDRGTDGSALLVQADQLMYRAKNQGKNRYLIAP